MHTTQKVLLKRIVLSGKQKYSALTRGFTYDDNILFHLNQLLKKNLLTKNPTGYTITKSGLRAINQFDPEKLDDPGFKPLLVGFLCSCGPTYLLKSHPQATTNFFNLPNGRPRFGENIENALERFFSSVSGLNFHPAAFRFRSLHLQTITTRQKEVLFDDAFVIFDVSVTPARKAAMKLHSQVAWYSKEEIKTLPNRWPEIDLCILKKDRTPYRVYSFTSDYIL